MNTSNRTLKTDDLSVGDTLIRVTRRGGNWGSEIRRFEKKLTVKKILKNRLVLTDAEGIDYRYIVEFSKSYTFRNGQVSTDLEGSRSRDNGWSINRDHKVLYTADDPDYTKNRDDDLERNRQIILKEEARKAIEAFKSSLSVDNAEAAIEALQSWVASQK